MLNIQLCITRIKYILKYIEIEDCFRSIKHSLGDHNGLKIILKTFELYNTQKVIFKGQIGYFHFTAHLTMQ